MHIIPVIDVKGGVAIAARGGDRANYKPLDTPLAKGSDPLAVARGYLALFPFKTLYIADLDGIEGRGANDALIQKLAKALPELELWVDNGANEAAAVDALVGIASVKAVIGSESGISPEEVAALGRRLPDRIVLSLDFKGEAFLGHRDLLGALDVWPARVIAMTLARVGTSGGPDLGRITDIALRAGRGRQVYAAGGMRHASDIEAARDAGAVGALVATALHTGQIKTGDLVEIAGKKFRST